MAKRGKRKAAPGDVASNRQAGFRYEFLEKLEAGLVLTGTEVKSLREGKAQLKDGYASVSDGELWLHNVHIPPYAPAAGANQAAPDAGAGFRYSALPAGSGEVRPSKA